MTHINLTHELGQHRATYYRVTSNERTLGSFASLTDALAFSENDPRTITIVQVDHYEHDKQEAIIMIAKPLPAQPGTI